MRIEDVDGNDIACTVNQVNGSNETNKIWNINAIFDAPYTGDVFAVIHQDGSWVRTDQKVSLVITNPEPLPTETPLPTQAPVATLMPVAFSNPEEQSSDNIPIFTQEPEVISAVVTWAPTAEPVPTEAPAEISVEETAFIPTEEPTPDPTAIPTEAPPQGPTLAPTITPPPRLEASEGANTLKNTDTVFRGKKSVSFSRETGYVAPHPDQYAHYPLGVPTFRGDNFRRNAAYGTADVQTENMSILWEVPLGSLRTEDNGTLYGVGWTGQPAIIHWTQQVREGMNLYEDKKSKVLNEVIFGAQDGKIYFLDLSDGSPTRDTINVGYPLKGSVSVDSWDRPLMAVGQGISKLANGKTGSIGLRLFNLVTGKEAYLLNGRKSDSQLQYNTNGAFDGTALFLFDNQGTDAMIVAGENGLLYTVDLNGKFIYPNADNPDAAVSIEIKPDITYLRTKSGNEKEASVGVESTVITLATDPPRILRPGIITREQIEAVIGSVDVDRAVLNKLENNEKAASPGMKYKHYAPRARVILLRGDDEKYITYLNRLYRRDKSVAALCYTEDVAKTDAPCITMGSMDDEAQQAQALFDALRAVDELDGVTTVYAHCPEATGVGMALYNRLIRAAAFEVIDLPKKRIIGLTGQTGAGKSEVSRMLTELGATVVSADEAAREAVEDAQVKAMLCAAFGDVLNHDGALNRQLVANIAFSTPENTKTLNAITHPTIAAIMLDKAKKAKSDVVFFDASQLFEAGEDVFCDRIIGVIAERDIRMERLLCRDSITREEAALRMAAQFDEGFFLSMCDDILYNNGTREELYTGVRALYERSVNP